MFPSHSETLIPSRITATKASWGGIASTKKRSTSYLMSNLSADVPSIRKVIQLSGEDPERRPWAWMPFTLLDLHCAFAKVQDRRNWKLPIYATIEAHELSVVIAAVVYFTGGGLCSQIRRADGKIEIVAHGYNYHIGM